MRMTMQHCNHGWVTYVSLRTAHAVLSFRRLYVFFYFFVLFTFSPLNVFAADTLQVEQPDEQKEMSWLRRTIRGFSKIDENYVEPQHYNWSVMLQAIYSFDYFRISTGDQSISFAPKPSVKAGPYFGWRWVFAGYTFDLRNIRFGGKKGKQELDFSIYAAQLGVDIYYRRTGSDYKIRNVNIPGVDTHSLEGLPFEGLYIATTGANLYYIFNHQRFSYPAAFAQSTCQKISCGSWMAGVGYLRNRLDFDHDKLKEYADRYTLKDVEVDTGFTFNSVRYTDVNLSAGYAYNWVFARNWLFCSSLSLALAYKKTEGDMNTSKRKHLGLDFDNFNIDGIGRFGLVWNNTRWYAGVSAIVRVYNYHKQHFATNNIFGSINLYVGYNFGLRSAYKKKKPN